MLKIGHRGAKGYCAENTLESIQKAFSLGVNGIEIDVHKCLTGEIVVFHDFMVDRLTNATGEIANLAWSDVQELRVDGKHRIPLLQEVLGLVPPNKMINVELKGRDTAKGTVLILQDFMDTKQLRLEQVFVSSFQKTELQMVSELNPDIQIGVLTQASVTEALSFAQEIKAYAIHPNYTLLSPAIVLKAHQFGFKVFAWTVNDKKDINRIRDYKVDGIISDFPDRL